MHKIYQRLDDFINNKEEKTLTISDNDLFELKADPNLYAVFFKDLKLNKIKIVKNSNLTLKKTFFTKQKRLKEIDIPINGRPDLNNIISLPIDSNIIFQGCMPMFHKSLHLWDQVGLNIIELFTEKKQIYHLNKKTVLNKNKVITVPLIKLEKLNKQETNPDIIFSQSQTLQFIKRKGLIAINTNKELQDVDLASFNQNYDFTISNTGIIDHKTNIKTDFFIPRENNFYSLISGESFTIDDSHIAIDQNNIKDRSIQNKILNDFPKFNRVIKISNVSYYDDFYINYSNHLIKAIFEPLSLLKLIKNVDFKFQILDKYLKEEFSISLSLEQKEILLNSRSDQELHMILRDILKSFTIFDHLIDEFFIMIDSCHFIKNYKTSRLFIEKSKILTNKLEQYLLLKYFYISELKDQPEIYEQQESKYNELIFFDVGCEESLRDLDVFLMKQLFILNINKERKIVLTSNNGISKDDFLKKYTTRIMAAYFVTEKKDSELKFESIDDIISIPINNIQKNQDKINRLKNLGLSDSDIFRLIYQI